MKHLYFIAILSMIDVAGSSQNWIGISFEDSTNLDHIKIDTSIAENIWEIGIPQKTVFSYSHSLPRAILTDSLSPYPPDNASIFYLCTRGDFNYSDIHQACLHFYYKVDTDTINDFGRIEISLDTGKTYQNILHCSGEYQVYDSNNHQVTSGGYGYGDSLLFTGSTKGWYLFEFSYDLPMYTEFDTIIYKFSFHSDSILADYDGWIIDDIMFVNFWEGLPAYRRISRIFPNPASDLLNISSTENIEKIDLYNIFGKCLLSLTDVRNKNRISIESLPDNQIYLIKISLPGDRFESMKFVKKH